jgi:hypothetical protein
MSCPYFRGAGAPERAGARVAALSGQLAPCESGAGGAAVPRPLALAPLAAHAPPLPPPAYAAELRACRAEVWQLCEEVNCNPILVRSLFAAPTRTFRVGLECAALLPCRCCSSRHAPSPAACPHAPPRDAPPRRLRTRQRAPHSPPAAAPP